MFGDYVYDKSSAAYINKLLLVDQDGLFERTGLFSAYSAHGFEVVNYWDDLTFRIEYQDMLASVDDKLVVIVKSEDYVPYDMIKRLRMYELSLRGLFPRLNEHVLKDCSETDLDLLSDAYPKNFDDLRDELKTEQYFRNTVYAKGNVERYVRGCLEELLTNARQVGSYKQWFRIAEEKARLDLLAVQHELEIDSSEINALFQAYVLQQFGKLSQNIDPESPVLVSRAMDYMHSRSDKFVIVIMDGMSEFDWRLFSESFSGIQYEKSSAFAMIPSTTSISRQCLLSNKYPSQLTEPWKQNKEKAEFVACARSLGYSDTQIGYERGYEAEFDSFVRCGAVIINDVDNMVHAQTQGRVGMYHDINLLAKQHKLRDLVNRLLEKGFDVYISADHGNTACIGLGRMMGSGVETETKSHKMVVLKDFADKDALIQKYGLIEYPKYYLPKEFDYLICNVGESLDLKGEQVMTHGGMSIDEVIVPFVKIKAGENNG